MLPQVFPPWTPQQDCTGHSPGNSPMGLPMEIPSRIPQRDSPADSTTGLSIKHSQGITPGDTSRCVCGVGWGAGGRGRGRVVVVVVWWVVGGEGRRGQVRKQNQDMRATQHVHNVQCMLLS